MAEDKDPTLRPWLESLEISSLLWIVPLVERLSNVRKFEDYASRVSPDTDPKALLGGFKQLLRVLLLEYRSNFDHSEFLGLKTDRITDRAVFVGQPPSKMSPTCEKANAIKNLGSLVDEISRAKNFDSLVTRLKAFEEHLSIPLLGVLRNNVSKARDVPPKVTKDSLLFDCGVFYLWSVAHDSDRLAPSFSSPLESLAMKDPKVSSIRKSWDYFFVGYRLGLAYLWHELLPGSSGRIVKQILASKNWDDFYETWIPGQRMVEEVFQSQGLKRPLGHEFRKRNSPNKSSFRWLLRKATEPGLSPGERMDELLFWYQMEMIDSARSKIFSGSSTLNSLMIGEVMERKAHGVDSKLQVVRFKHADALPRGAPWFSYAVLMERHGSLSDFSGWLLFMEVGGDYAGLGGSEYYLTEATLKMLRKSVEVRESSMSVQSLRQYFLGKLKGQAKEVPSPTFSQTDYVRFRVDDLEKANSALLGRLIEFLARQYFEEAGLQSTIYFRDSAILPRNQEIDVLALDSKSGTAIIAECSTNLPIQRIGDFISELASKEAALKRSERYSSYRKLAKVFVTTRRSIQNLDSKTLGRLTKARISLLTVEDDVIPRLRRDYRREELLALFGARRKGYQEYEA